MKRSVLVLVSSLLIFFIDAKAQEQSFLQWQSAFGFINYDGASSAIQTNDGGYLVTGIVNNEDGFPMIAYCAIRKLDANHQTIWTHTYGDYEYNNGNVAKQLKNGNFIVAGEVTHNKDLVSKGYRDFWVFEIDTSGNLLWQKNYGGSEDDLANDIQLTSDNGFIIAGYSGSKDGDLKKNNGSNDYWIIKLDSAGDLQWQKSYGGIRDDEANSVKQTTDGGYIVGGTSYSNSGDVHNNHGGGDYCVFKLDANGNIQWQNSYGGTSNDYFEDIQLTQDGSYIMIGSTISHGGEVTNRYVNSSAWIVKIDIAGSIMWEKTFGSKDGNFNAKSIKQTRDGSYIFTGDGRVGSGKLPYYYFYPDFWIVKTDTTGMLLWQKLLGGSADDEASDIELTNDGGYIVAGSTESHDGNVSGPLNSLSGYWVVKLSPDELPHNITATNYDTTGDCSIYNHITFQVKNYTMPVTMNLYRLGNLYKTRDSVTEYVTFNDLKPGQYYATITSGDSILSTSNPINITPVATGLKAMNVTSTSANLSWMGLPCADDYSIQFKKPDSADWVIRHTGDSISYYLQNLSPLTTYLIRLGIVIHENGINATGKRYDSLTFTTLAASGDAAIAEKLNVLSNTLSITPNPASSYFIINYSSTINKKANAILYDVNGKAVWTSGLVNTEAFISKKVITSQLPNGVYYLKLMDDSGTSINTKKIITTR